MSVKLIKLVTGEEILCNAEKNDTGYTINECIAVVLQPGPGGPQGNQMGFAFIPWATMAKDNVEIYDMHVIYAVDPEDTVLAHYNKMFAKITVPSKDLIIAR